MSKFIKGRGYTATITFDLGEKIILEIDDTISYSIFTTGVYQDETIHTDFFRKIVQKGMVVLDIGAHIGYYTLQAAMRVGEQGQVHAFEPVSESYERLVENIRLNNLRSVFANRYIVHDHNGKMNIFVANETQTSLSRISAMSDYRRIEEVECIKIDSYLKERGVYNVHLAKIDTEGSELYALKGMSNLLKNQDELQLLVEISESNLREQGCNSRELFDYLHSFGFSAYKICKNGLVKIQDPYSDMLVLFRKD